MFDLGMGELLLIGIVALIVVGPKDLPVMFRTVGRFTGKMKAMARDFQRAMNEAADDTGMREIDRDLRKMTSARKLGLDKLDEASKAFAKWDPMGDAAVAKRAGAPAPATSAEARGPRHRRPRRGARGGGAQGPRGRRGDRRAPRRRGFRGARS